MAKNKLNRSKLPFRLKNEIELKHKCYYLHYVNELIPHLGDEIRSLTPICVKFFGEFPINIETLPYPDNLGVFYPVPREFGEGRKRWFRIRDVFKQCIWSGTRDYEGSVAWQAYLVENDPELKGVCEILSKFIEDVNKIHERYVNECFDELKKDYSEVPPEKLTKANLTWTLAIHYLRDQYQRSDSDYRYFSEIEKQKMDKLTGFQKAFDSLLNDFYLDKPWLAFSVFIAIWSGTGKLLINAPETIDEKIEKEITEELEQLLGKVEIEESNKLKLKHPLVGISDGYDYSGYSIPLNNPFTYEEEFKLWMSIENYEEAAISQYRQHLHEYFRIIRKVLKNRGHKETRGDSHDYENLQRLVYWNKSAYEFIWEVIQDIPEFSKVRLDNKRQVDSTVDKLRKSFNKYQEFDLPVRPFGVNRN